MSSSYACHDSFTSQVCRHSPHASRELAEAGIHTCDMSHSYVCHDKCATTYSCSAKTGGGRHLFVWHVTIICVPWLTCFVSFFSSGHVCPMTHACSAWTGGGGHPYGMHSGRRWRCAAPSHCQRCVVCCTVLRCVALCCWTCSTISLATVRSVMQCVAECCRVLLGAAGCCRTCFTISLATVRSVLQSVAECCWVLLDVLHHLTGNGA